MAPTVGDMLIAIGKLPRPAEKRRWNGTPPTQCDICRGTLGSVFYDGATKHGPWALMCHSCHRQHGRGLGTGRGQKYNTKTLEKVEG